MSLNASHPAELPISAKTAQIARQRLVERLMLAYIAEFEIALVDFAVKMRNLQDVALAEDQGSEPASV
jgi:hypothetical protein